MTGSFIDLSEYFSDVLEGNGDMIDEFLHSVNQQYGNTFEWQFEDGMYEMNAGVIGIMFDNPLDTVFFKMDIDLNFARSFIAEV